MVANFTPSPFQLGIAHFFLLLAFMPREHAYSIFFMFLFSPRVAMLSTPGNVHTFLLDLSILLVFPSKHQYDRNGCRITICIECTKQTAFTLFKHFLYKVQAAARGLDLARPHSRPSDGDSWLPTCRARSSLSLPLGSSLPPQSHLDAPAASFQPVFLQCPSDARRSFTEPHYFEVTAEVFIFPTLSGDKDFECPVEVTGIWRTG